MTFNADILGNTTLVQGSLAASSGQAVFNIRENRIEWTGDIPAGETVRITFDTVADDDLAAGDTVAVQGTVTYDSDDDGLADAATETDNDDGESGNQPSEITVPVIPVSSGYAMWTDYTSTGLNGTLNPGGSPATYYFEYGTDPENLGSATPAGSAGTGYDNVYISKNIRGLAEGTVYYYRLVHVNSGGTLYGDIETFTTRYTLPGGDGMGIHKSDPEIASWAAGWVDPVNYGEILHDRWKVPKFALGVAQGDLHNDFVSLGTGGSMILTFSAPITDGPGWDFAAFDVSPSDTSRDLAYVDVSSDGENFVRFDSLFQSDFIFGQIVRPELLSGLAGKYREGYGTPFDLADLGSRTEVRNGILNIKRITHVRITDVIGGKDRDSLGNTIYDALYNEDSTRAGFDVDAVAVKYQYIAPGDVNGDGSVDLTDAILTLKIIAGMSAEHIYIMADVNGDMKIGFEELFYILRYVSEM